MCSLHHLESKYQGELERSTSTQGGRRGGLGVSAFVSEASGLGSSPGLGHCVVFLGKLDTTLTVPLIPQICKLVPANVMLGVTLRWTKIFSNHFMLQKPG